MKPQYKQHLQKLEGDAAWEALNLDTGHRLSHNSRRFLAASTIKLPVLAVYAQTRSQALTYHYNPKDYVEDSPYFDTVKPGQALSGDTLAEWMMIRSDNTATNLLIHCLGLEKIQQAIESWGMKDTVLQRLMMDLEARQTGRENWTTPADMCLFMQYLVTGELASRSACDWMLDILYRSEDLEKIPHGFQKPVRVANKPGELPGTRSDVAYVHDSQHRVVMALFTDELPNEEAEVAADDWLAELAQILWQDLCS